MNTRIINSGEKINLKNGNHIRSFEIIKGESEGPFWYKLGGSVICYDAKFTDDNELYHYGKLKQFYLMDDTKDFEKEAYAFISSYVALHRIVSENKSMSKLYAFVPEFEIYFDEKNCPYLWTNNVPMKTFEELYKQIMVSGRRIEDSLYEIVSTLKALTDCIRIIHENGLIHGDIKPSNFGFYMREERILADSVSLFDLDTLRLVSEAPKGYTHPYYDEIPRTGEYANRADIRAIGISFCNALGIDDNQIERKKNAGKMLKEERIRAEVRKIIIDAKIFSFIGQSVEEGIKEQIITLVTETVAKTHRTMIPSCTKLYKKLQLLETSLLPYCTKDELGRGLGIEIVSKELQRRDKVKEVFQYTLYEDPLFLYESDSDEYKVVLVGFGLDSQCFLDVCLETAQAMNSRIEVDVWGTERIDYEKNYYLENRPALNQFFLVDNQEELLSGESYGSINFNIRANKKVSIQVDKIIESSGDINYIYIAAGNDKENSEIAHLFRERLSGKNVSINSQCENKVENQDGIHFICVNKKNKEWNNYTEIERMSFNSHLVWSGSLNANLKIKKENYKSDYYHASCVSNVLSIKYKLHSVGIELSDDMCLTAREFVHLPDKLKRKLVYTEHRRWVTEKLCSGWTNMKVEDSLPYNDTKDINGKRHVCIIRSNEAYGLAGKWTNHKLWDNASSDDLSELDELDMMSVKLHQTYREYAEKLSIDYLFLPNDKEIILNEIKDYKSIESIFFEWLECAEYLFGLFVVNANTTNKEDWKITEYDALYSKLLTSLNDIESETIRQSLYKRIASINNNFMPIARCLRYHDYKKNDRDLIDAIPFILTYTENITMIVPMDYDVLTFDWNEEYLKYGEHDKEIPTRLFSYVAAATVVNPKDLYLPYIAKQKARNTLRTELIKEKENALNNYVKRKGLQTRVHFVRKTTKTDVRAILNINNDAKFDGWLLVEDNDLGIVDTKDLASISKQSGTFSFDMANVSFDGEDTVKWLNSIKRKVGLTMRDVADFLGRRVQIPEQPSFRRCDITTLFEIYKEDRVAWNDMCNVLMPKDNQKNAWIRFTNPSNGKVFETLQQHVFFMDYSCFKSANSIITLLKNYSIIDNRSTVFRYSTDACKAVLFENGMYGDNLQKIFREQDILSSQYDYSIDEKRGKLVLSYESLIIKDIEYELCQRNNKSRRILTALKKLQEAGFIQLKVNKKTFDIIYGSWQIKNLFMKAGNFLEVFTFYKAKERNVFDDVLTSVSFFYGDSTDKENEIDCFLIKGFKTLLVECKSRSLGNNKSELRRIRNEFQKKIKKFAINGSGLLVIDSETGVPELKMPDKVTLCEDINVLIKYIYAN